MKSFEGDDYIDLGGLGKYIPKDLKGALGLINNVIPGVKDMEDDLSAVSKLAKPLLNKLPLQLVNLLPNSLEILNKLWSGEQPKDEDLIKWFRALDMGNIREWIKLAVADETTSLLKKIEALKLEDLEIVKPLKPGITGLIKVIKDWLKILKKLGRKYDS